MRFATLVIGVSVAGIVAEVQAGCSTEPYMMLFDRVPTIRPYSDPVPIRATLIDGCFNPMSNVEVLFTLSQSDVDTYLTEIFDYTDSNGTAETILIPGPQSGLALYATIPGPVQWSLRLSIAEPSPTPTIIPTPTPPKAGTSPTSLLGLTFTALILAPFARRRRARRYPQQARTEPAMDVV